MSASSTIEWTDATWNPIRARNSETGRLGWHCEHVSEGCRNCYAESMNRRLGTGFEFKPGNRDNIELFLDEKMLLAPLSWRKPRMIFVCSMSDVFADFVYDEWLNRIFAVMALCPRHTFQILTKRPARMRKYLANEYGALPGRIFPSWVKIAVNHFGVGFKDPQPLNFPLPNVWLGTSCEDQATADERIPDLLATPAAMRFVSCEPMLGPIELWRFDQDDSALRGCAVIESGGMTIGTADAPAEGYDDSYPGIDWVICGGESGLHARPMQPAWAKALRDQCAAAGVPYFFKQMTKKAPIPDDLFIREFPNAS